MNNYFDDLNHVKSLLNEGKVVLCPTDTIWGLSCDAFNQKAVQRIYDIKKRDLNKPCILLVDNIAHLKKWVKDVHPRVETLIHYHLRPISVIYKASPAIPQYLQNENGTIAIRVTRFKMLQDIISDIGKPLISTSANIQGIPSPQTFQEIDSEIISAVDYVFQTGRLNNHKARSSQLISWDNDGELFFHR